MDPILDALAPHLAEILGFALLGLFGWIGRGVSRYLGLKAEAIWRDALHSALETGALRADEPDDAAAVRQIVDYARRSVPDAIQSLGAAPDVLEDLARAKLAQQGLRILYDAQEPG